MSTSKLQCLTEKQLRKRFGKYGLVENSRPRWLISSKGERLELDLFIDKLSIAVEVQGKQHRKFVSYFHQTKYGFYEQLRRDQEKRQICDRRGITLLYVNSKTEIGYVIASIIEVVERRLEIDNDEDDVFFILRNQSPKKKKQTLGKKELGLLQIKEATRGYEKRKEKTRKFSETGFHTLCAGIRRLLELEELSKDECFILAQAIWLKNSLKNGYKQKSTQSEKE